jgi:hypothetical protein
MIWFENVYNFFHSIFEIISFRTKPKLEIINDDYVEYEFIIFKDNKIVR